MRVKLPPEQQSEALSHIPEHYAPEIFNAGVAFSVAVYRNSKLTTRECEAARARTAEINGCHLCQNFRVARDLSSYFASVGIEASDTVAARGPAPDEEFYSNVSNWREYPGYSERERVAIAIAESMGLDPQGLSQDDALWARAKAVYSDNELVDLVYALASWIGLGRAAHVLGLDGACAWAPDAA